MGRYGHRGFLSFCGGLGIGLLAGLVPLARAEEPAAPPAGQAAGSGGADTAAEISNLAALVSQQEATITDLAFLSEERGKEIAELKREIEDLLTIIEGDRARLDALEKAQGEPHKAPFTVVNDAGELLFNVASGDVGAMVNIFGQSQIDLVAGGTAQIALSSDTQEATIAVDDGGIRQTFGPTRGDPNLEIALDGGGMRLSLAAGEGRATLTASDDEAGMHTTGKGRDLYFGSFPDFSGLRFFDGGKIGVALTDAGTSDGFALSFYADGSKRPDLVVGRHKDGRLAYSLWEGDNPLVRIEAGNDTGSGAVRLYDGGKEAVTLGKVGLDMLGMSVVSADASLLAGIDGKEQVFSFGSESAPLFSARAGGGGNTATLTLGKELAVLRTTDDGAGELTLGTPAGTAARLGTDADGKGDLTLSDAGSPFADLGQIGGIGALSLMEGEAPAITLGRTAERSTVAFRAFRAWRDGQMAVAAGVSKDGEGAVAVYNNNGDMPAAGLRAYPEGGSVFVASQGNVIASMNGVDNPGQGLVVIRSPDGTALATLGNGSGGGGNVTLRDPGGNGVASAGYVAGDSGPGAICVEHKGTKCLGIGLTGMEGFLSR